MYITDRSYLQGTMASVTVSILFNFHVQVNKISWRVSYPKIELILAEHLLIITVIHSLAVLLYQRYSSANNSRQYSFQSYSNVNNSQQYSFQSYSSVNNSRQYSFQSYSSVNIPRQYSFQSYRYSRYNSRNKNAFNQQFPTVVLCYLFKLKHED